MKRCLISFVAFLFLIIPLSQNELLAGGSDVTGYIITSADTPQPYDLGNGAIIYSLDVPGVYVYSSGQAIKNGGSITTDGGNAHGVRVTGTGSSINLTDVDIKTSGSYANGLRVQDNATAVVNGGSILQDGSHGSGHAVYVDSADVTLNNVDITTLNSGAHAIYVLNNAKVTVEGGSIYSANNGYSSQAVYLYGKNSTVHLTDVDITTESGNCLFVGLNSSISGNEIYIKNSTLTNNNTANYAVLSMQHDNYMEIRDSNIISTSGTIGFVAGFEAEAYLENVSISLNGTSGGNHAIWVDSGSKVTFKSMDIIQADPTALAIMTYNTVSDYGWNEITGLESVYNINGGIWAYYESKIDITMADSSVFNGWTYYTSETTSIMNLTLKGANTRWNLQGDGYRNQTGFSHLTNLTLDGSTVDYTNADWGTYIYAQNLNPGTGSTGGTFIMKTDILSQDRTDLLYVAVATEGQHSISVTGDAGAATDGTEKLILVETEDQGGNFTLVTGTVDYGAWRYVLEQDAVNYGSGAVWQLYSTGALTAPASNAVNTFSGAYLLTYAETQTLIQRLGDLRQTPHLNGFWFRAHGGKFESNSRSFVQGFDMKYGGVQIGYDRQVETRLVGQLYIGGMFGYSKGDLDYLDTGSGTVDSKTLGVYGTYIGPDGFYVDAVLKYQWMNNDFDALDYALDRVTGSGVSTGGLGASLEIGKRIHIEKSKENSKTGWYVEPQAQLIYQHQDSGSFTASNGLNIGVDSFTSLIGRVGALVGYETGKTNFYAKASYVKEFDGDVNIIANDVSIPESFGDHWWVYGIGFTSVVNERNSIYASIERASGGVFTQPWRVDIGWRIVF